MHYSLTWFQLYLIILWSMLGSYRNTPQISKKQKQEKEWLGVSFKPENFIPGLVIGLIIGFILDLSKPVKSSSSRKIGGKKHHQSSLLSSDSDEELKMVLVVRQDLKMGAGKIASQCAHAATGIYSELMERFPFNVLWLRILHVIHFLFAILWINMLTKSHRSLLRQWEFCGQAKIVVTCKNQQEMNKLRDAAERIHLPTFLVADAGRTQVSAGSNTVLAIGPGSKSAVDSVTGKQRLL